MHDEAVALVTGAGKRLGRAIAERLAAGGCRVAVHYGRSAGDAKETVARIRKAGGEARAFRADLSKKAAPARLVKSVEKAFGHVDVLVNNASVFRPTPFLESTDKDLEEHFAVNFRAPYLLCHAVAGGMVKRGHGKIVNLGDIHGERPLRDHAPYCASKSALHMLTRSLARDLAPAVQVNAVLPGAILLPKGAKAAFKRKLVSRIPAGRLGTPKEIADTVAFLVEGPDFVTGQLIRVDGGRTLAG
ncbi:MAG: SDR family NAD(P)-dependent oxidoreductase [Planctomycetota bacterium]